MSAAQTGEAVNALRVKLGKKPLKDPQKIGGLKLVSMLVELQKEHDKMFPPPPPPPPAPKPFSGIPAAPRPRKKPVYVVVEKGLDEDALVQPDRQETIRSMSERLLVHVVYKDETDHRTVGLLYGTIIALIKKKFPKAVTTIECLRWYAVHMRADSNGKRLPQKRPRPGVRA